MKKNDENLEIQTLDKVKTHFLEVMTKIEKTAKLLSLITPI